MKQTSLTQIKVNKLPGRFTQPFHAICATLARKCLSAVFPALIGLMILPCLVRAQESIKFTQGEVNEGATLSLGVPLGNYAGRGLSLPITMNYSSSVWRIERLKEVGNYYAGLPISQTVTQTIYSEHTTSGWKSSLDIPTLEWPHGDEHYGYDGKQKSGCNWYRIAKVTVHMPDGSTHVLRKSDVPYYFNDGSLDMFGKFYAVDNSRILFDATGENTGTIYMPTGIRYVLEASYVHIIDANGNTVTYNKGNGQWTDTLGRTFVNPIPASPAAQDYTYTLPGLNGVSPGGLLTYTLKWRHLGDALTPDDNNNTPSLHYMAEHYLPYPYWEPYGSPNYENFPQTQNTDHEGLFHPEFTYNLEGDPSHVPVMLVGKQQSAGQLFNPIVLTEIVLPDGTSYKFGYNVYGEMDKIVYPAGGYEKYKYDKPTPSEDLYTDYPYYQADRIITNRKVSVNGTGNDIAEWKYSGDTLGHTAIIAPDNTRTEISKQKYFNVHTRFGYGDSRVGLVVERRMYSTSPNGTQGSLLRRELFEHAQTVNAVQRIGTCNQTNYNLTFYAPRNPRLSKQVNIIFEGSGSALAETQTVSYDTSNEMTTGLDQTLATAHNYVVVDNATAQTASIGQIPTGSLARSSETGFVADQTYRDLNILGLQERYTVKDAAGNIISQKKIVFDESGYSPAVGRALPTSEKVWDSTKGPESDPNAYITTRSKFDSYGNKIESTNARGFTTVTGYDATYHAFPVSVTTPIPDPGNTNGSANSFVAQATYDATTGLRLTTTDHNGYVTTFSFDALLRPVGVLLPTGGGQSITEYGAGNTAQTRYVKVRKKIDPTNWEDSYTWYDGMGKTIKKQSVNVKGDVFIDSEYDNMGRLKRASQPYRAGDTVNWLENVYDDLGRIKTVIAPDNTQHNSVFSLATTGSHIGKVSTSTDQAGKTRRGISNSLGQLVRIDEPNNSGQLGAIDSPNQPAVYQYDALGNLKLVTQGGQTRTFTFDSLSRVQQVSNPESGTISYTYDNNGNVIGKTDARSITTTYSYDQIDRVKGRTYSDSTPAAAFYYDGVGASVPNSKNKLTKVTSGISMNEYANFDAMGRLLTFKQTTDGNAYTTTYVYNLAGKPIEERYPSGRVVKNTFDTSGDLSQIQSSKSNGGMWTYASGFSYAPTGAVTSMQLGNSNWESIQFNERLQITQIGLGNVKNATNKLKLNYNFGNDNNGTVRSQTINVPNAGAHNGFLATQTYAYDSLNRLREAKEVIDNVDTWKQTFTYDRFGNRNFDEALTTTLPKNCVDGGIPVVCAADRKIYNPEIDPANNRIKTTQNYGFDAAGNTTGDAEGRTFIYNAENLQKEVKNSQNQTIGEYFYNSDGRRVKKIAGSEKTIFVYDASGRMIEEYSTTLSSAPVVNYLTSDNLGSPRINTDAGGNVLARHDYLPFGEDLIESHRTEYLGYQTDDKVRKKFTGYERDEETGLDYAQARMYRSKLGRFSSPDKVGNDATPAQPQSWNLYTYTRNNPLNYVDPTGKMIWIYVTVTDENGNSTTIKVQYVIDQNGNSSLRNADGSEYKGNNATVNKVRSHLDFIKNMGEIGGSSTDGGPSRSATRRADALKKMAGDHYHHDIIAGKSSANSDADVGGGTSWGVLDDGGANTQTYYDPDKSEVESGNTSKPEVTLARELLGVAYGVTYERDKYYERYFYDTATLTDLQVDSTIIEQAAREQLGLPRRQTMPGLFNVGIPANLTKDIVLYVPAPVEDMDEPPPGLPGRTNATEIRRKP